MHAVAAKTAPRVKWWTVVIETLLLHGRFEMDAGDRVSALAGWNLGAPVPGLIGHWRDSKHVGLLLYQFHAAVLSAAVLALIGGDGGERAGALGGEARGGDTVLRGQGGDHVIGAALGEIHTDGEGANAIGVADDQEFERGHLLEEFGDLLERGVGLGLDLGLGGVEVDPIDGGVATARDVAAERRGIDGDEAALHGLNLDDVEHDGRPFHEIAPLADMHRHVDVALGPGTLRRDGALAGAPTPVVDSRRDDLGTAVAAVGVRAGIQRGETAALQGALVVAEDLQNRAAGRDGVTDPRDLAFQMLAFVELGFLQLAERQVELVELDNGVYVDDRPRIARDQWMVFAIREVLWLCAADGGGQSANETNGADSAIPFHDWFLSPCLSQKRPADAVRRARITERAVRTA